MAGFPTAGWELASCAVDFLTATAKTEAHKEAFRTLGRDVLAAEVMAKEVPKPLIWNAYRGTATTHFAWGERDDSVLLRFSGPLASEWHNRVAACADNVSRCDIQATFRRTDCSLDCAAYVVSAAHKHAKERGKELKVEYQNSGPLASTAYVGSRKSDLFLRVYNKEKQSGLQEDTGAWRWELETKGKTAKRISSEVRAGGVPATVILGLLRGYCRTRHIPIPEFQGDARPVKAERRGTSSAEAKLAWLSRQVKPTVGLLLGYYEKSRVLEALGLD